MNFVAIFIFSLYAKRYPLGLALHSFLVFRFRIFVSLNYSQVIPVEKVIEIARRRAGRFILATNVLDEDILPNDKVLIEYKGQQSSERGFRFLKDPLFFTSSVFLNTPRRVAALAMVMGLCLLVYTLGQRQLRQALAHAEETIPNQLKQPTSTPT